MVGLTVIQGDTIRAYDFKPIAGREDCFIEGQVIDAHSTEQGYQAYKTRVVLVSKCMCLGESASTSSKVAS
jgi:hypothetical protein